MFQKHEQALSLLRLSWHSNSFGFPASINNSVKPVSYETYNVAVGDIWREKVTFIHCRRRAAEADVHS